MPESNKNKGTDDEIDLLDLFRRIGKGLSKMFRSFGRGILVTIVFMFRKWLPLFISVLLGVGVSYLFNSMSSSFYTSDLTIKSNATPNADLISHIEKLNKFCMEGNLTALAEALSMDSVQVKDINDIKALWVIDKGKDEIPDYVDDKNRHNVYDTVNIRMQDRLVIRVKTSVPQELTALREGLFAYITGDSLFQQKNRVRLRQTDEFLARLNYDIKQLDSLQQIKYFEETRRNQAPAGGQLVFLQPPSTQLIYSDIYTLYQRKQQEESERALYSDIITLLSDFTLPFRPENSVFYYGKVIIPLFFFAAILLILLYDNRKKLIDIYNKY
jgi:hypothetical protein